MEVLKFPNKVLFEPCLPVTTFGEGTVAFLDMMWTVMRANKGMGLAANQIGYSKAMFVMESEKRERFQIVNPKVSRKSLLAANLREGCLSAPEEFLVVPQRSQWIEIEYQDGMGNKHVRMFSGIDAVCIQHEMEHLEGKAYFQNDMIPKLQRKALNKQWGRKKF